MGKFDIHDVEFDGVFVPDAMDAGGVVEAFEPDVAVGEGGFARFDEDLGAGFRIAQHEKDGGGGVFVHEGGVVRRDVDVEHADIFVLQHFVVTGFLAYLDLGVAGGGEGRECEEEKDGLAHAAR